MLTLAGAASCGPGRGNKIGSIRKNASKGKFRRDVNVSHIAQWLLGSAVVSTTRDQHDS